MRKILNWIWPRSGGVRVRRRVARLIAKGNAAARSRGDWAAAASAYAAAVREQPELAAIWVQLGHAARSCDRE